MSPEPTLLLSRRNGRPVACVPCRARKVACDHRRPICNRCRRRGHSDLCRYPEATISYANESDPETSSLTELALPSQPQVSTRQGYMGFTSFNNVFEETESRFASLFWSPMRIGPETLELENREARVSFRDLPVPVRETCLLVLRGLPGQRNEQFRFRDHIDPPYGWTYMAVEKIIQTLQLTFGDTLSQGEAGLQTMIEILCANTRRRIRDDLTDPMEWIGQFCGANLRWESIGILWAHLSRISDIIDSLRPRRLEWIEGKESHVTAHTHLARCIHITMKFTDCNDILIDITRRKTTLISIIDGDAAFSTLSSHGLTVSMVMYLGFHAIEQTSDYNPTLISEHKRKIFAQVYTSDKLGTSFTGRPPLINRRYCSTPLPLDLSDADLIADQETLRSAVLALDERGWNTSGKIHSTTLIRARCMLAYIYDSLFEIALSRDGKDRTNELLDIRERSRATRAGFPESLKYHAGDATDPSVDTKTLYFRIVLQLAYLNTIFFAERLLSRHGGGYNGDLVATSYELVCVTLKIWVYKDRFASVSILRNFDWLLMAHGAPAGGVLCQELLSPTFSATHPNHPELTRSSLIQQLSLLLGFLDWVPNNAPNAKQCSDAKAAIQRILDQYLNAPSGQNLYENIDWGLMAQPNYSFDLLNTFEWMPSDIQ